MVKFIERANKTRFIKHKNCDKENITFENRTDIVKYRNIFLAEIQNINIDGQLGKKETTAEKRGP